MKLLRESLRNFVVGPAADLRRYIHDNLGDHGHQEGTYRHLFLRALADAGIPDDYVPIEGAANYSMLYLIAATMAPTHPRHVDDVHRFGEQQTLRVIEQNLRDQFKDISAMTFRSNKHQRLIANGTSIAELLKRITWTKRGS